jgi:N-acetylneuraminic acid mutarotase
MGKKDNRSKSAEQKARAQAKQSKKAAKGEKKVRAKGGAREDDSDADDIDIDAVLASYAQEQAKFLKVTEQTSDAPSPRSSSTVLASPFSRNEIFVFGGEYFDGTLATFFNDLFVYLIDRGEWRQVTSPNSPLPRSGHTWCRGGNSGGIYLFGGEFSSPKQGTFYHYNDFWYLDPSTREWTRLEGKGKGPPARSGHRMTYFKNYILLFGGFQDTSQQTKYLQDLWIYDCQNFVWHEAKLPPATQKPDARSSFSFLPHEFGAVIYGGYSRVKAATTAGKQGKCGPQRNVLRPIIHQDTWFLRITSPGADAAPSLPPIVRWERRKKPANPPNPTRAGATLAHHKGRGIMFGGVHDVEESEEGIESEFFDALYAWNIDRNRFFPLTLRRAKAPAKRPQPVRARDRGKADEEELLRNLAALETRGAITDASEMEMDIDQQPPPENVNEKKDFTIRFEMPHRRFNAQLAVQDDTLFIFGGTFERGDQEFTFNDMFSIDLGKLDGVREIFYREPENWNTKIDESDEDDEGDEISDGDSDSDDAMSIDATSISQIETCTAPTELTKISSEPQSSEMANETETSTSAQEDPRPFPRPFENLREFYARTSTGWQNLVLDKMKYGAANAASEQSIKELRKKAFDEAEERWWDCREEIRALEDEQEAAGIGEVVSIADRGADSGGGRRR